MLASLGDKEVLVLRNRGVAVCGADIARAFMVLWTLQRAAEIQCQAGMLPGPNTALSDAVRQHHAAASSRLIQADGFASKVFDTTIRLMRAAQL